MPERCSGRTAAFEIAEERAKRRQLGAHGRRYVGISAFGCVHHGAHDRYGDGFLTFGYHALRHQALKISLRSHIPNNPGETSKMPRAKAFAIASTFACLVSDGATSYAAERVDVGMMTGKCSVLIASDRDFSNACEGKILNSGHANGRVGFYFFISDKAVLTISGEDLPNPSADMDETRVDMILLNLGIEGVPPSETKAFGKCRYDNPFQGVPVKVRCNGTTEDGTPFEAQFLTDGSEPRMLSDLELADLPPAVLEALKPGLTGDPKLEGQ